VAELVILGRLRAPYAALKQQVQEFESKYTDPGCGIYVNDIAIIPVQITGYPQHLRESCSKELDGGLFVDYAIASMSSAAYSAFDTQLIDEYRGTTYTFGSRSRVIREVWCHDRETWIESDLRAQKQLEDVGSFADFEEYSYDETFDIRKRVDGRFETKKFAEWTRRQISAVRAHSDARLVIIISREEFTEFEKTREFGKLIIALGGQAASVVLRASRFVAIAFPNSSCPRFASDVVHYVKPRLIEDFVTFAISKDVAVMRAGLGHPLASWTEKVQAVSPTGNEKIFTRHCRQQKNIAVSDTENTTSADLALAERTKYIPSVVVVEVKKKRRLVKTNLGKMTLQF
jgi:hypothetical protein